MLTKLTLSLFFSIAEIILFHNQNFFLRFKPIDIFMLFNKKVKRGEVFCVNVKLGLSKTYFTPPVRDLSTTIVFLKCLLNVLSPISEPRAPLLQVVTVKLGTNPFP